MLDQLLEHIHYEWLYWGENYASDVFQILRSIEWLAKNGLIEIEWCNGYPVLIKLKKAQNPREKNMSEKR